MDAVWEYKDLSFAADQVVGERSRELQRRGRFSLGFWVLLVLGLVTFSQSSMARDEYIRLFTEKHFDGDTIVYTPLSNHSDLGRLNKRIMSVIYRLPPGRVVVLFTDRNYQGNVLELHGTGYPVQLAELGLYERTAQSIRWDTTAGELVHAELAYARIYERESFKGRRLTVTYGQNIPNLRQVEAEEQGGGFENSASSVRWLLAPGWTIILHRGRNFTGDTIELRGTGRMEQMTTLGNFAGRASSLQWIAPGPVESLGD
ncbi:MAG: hypothetical protein ACFCU3_00480 [Verrucomicrobiales bacterium]